MGLSQSSSVTMATKQWVDETIKSAPVVVFSKSYCPFCKMAKEALEKAGVDLKNKSKIVIIEIENKNNCGEIQDYLQTLTKARSVPRVFINGTCIGGGSETKEALQSGKLKKMLEEAGAL